LAQVLPLLFASRDSLLIGVFAVSNCHHIDQSRIVKDLVHDPVFSNADSPEVPRSQQFTTARRAWIPGQRLNPRENPRYEARIQALELFPGGPGKTDNVFTHSVLACGYAAVAAAH
jgi:hypothetical protein